MKKYLIDEENTNKNTSKLFSPNNINCAINLNYKKFQIILNEVYLDINDMDIYGNNKKVIIKAEIDPAYAYKFIEEYQKEMII